MTIQKQTLIDVLSETVGEAKAQQVVENAANQAGLSRNQTLSKDEAMEIASCISNADDSLVRVSANTIKTQIQTGKIAA